MEALEVHLAWWMREVADTRCHGSTGEPPLQRFVRDEASKLKPLAGRPPFRQLRELLRKVHAEASGRHRRLTDPAHFVGVTGVGGPARRSAPVEALHTPPPELLRPLVEYEQLVGGRW